jgi:molecular chaperone DnaK
MVSTVVDEQASVKIHVLQGEEELAKDNISLGDFELTGIKAAPKGQARIEVTFTIDTDGIVNVAARDVKTGTRTGITIHSPSSMTQEDLDTAREELAGFERADEADREVDEYRHRVEKQLFALENFLRANQVKLKKREIFDTEQALKRGRMALVKRADSTSLKQLSQFLRNYHASLRDRAEAAGDLGIQSVSLSGTKN